MKEYFDSVRNKLAEGLADQGYTVKSENYTGSNLGAILENETDALLLEYISKDKQFVLSRGEAGCAKDDFVQAQAYLFDTDAGDDMRHTTSVANEFLDTLQAKKSAVGGTYKRAKKDKDSDESSANFFVNRLATVLPECREPLLMHKNHYGMLLPRHFCEEVGTVALADAFRKGEKAKMRGFAELVNNIYPTADMDTKAIIMQVLMPVITAEKDVEFVEGIVSAEFSKSWRCARKYHGKEVKPEKLSAYAKMAKYQGDTLVGTKH
ncbi:MAG: hypothetical protein E7554_09825 [Ruminococcaceae bacterium]|nr:hypothetical protein [Oscillospiraceae bacterium]